MPGPLGMPAATRPEPAATAKLSCHHTSGSYRKADIQHGALAIQIMTCHSSSKAHKPYTTDAEAVKRGSAVAGKRRGSVPGSGESFLASN